MITCRGRNGTFILRSFDVATSGDEKFVKVELNSARGGLRAPIMIEGNPVEVKALLFKLADQIELRVNVGASRAHIAYK